MQEVSGSFRLPEGKRKTEIRLDVRYSGGDKRDRTADLLNAIAPEVLDSVEVMKKVRENRIKWTFHSPYRSNWYMVFRHDSGTNSGTKSSAETKCSAHPFLAVRFSINCSEGHEPKNS